MLDLGNGIDDATDEAYKDSRHTGKRHGGIEEDQSGKRNGELVQSSNHRVGGGRGHTDTPSGSVGNEDGRRTGEDHGEDNAVALGCGEVTFNVGGRPVFGKDRKNDEDGNGQKVVVEHG